MATPNFADLRMPAGPADGLASTDQLGLADPLTPASQFGTDPLAAGPVSAVALMPGPGSTDQAGAPSGSVSPTAPNPASPGPATAGTGRSGTGGGGTGQFFRSRRGLGIVAPIAAIIIVAVVVLVLLPSVGHPIIGLGGGSGVGQGAVGDHLRGKSVKPGQPKSAGSHRPTHPGHSAGSSAPAPGQSSSGKSAPGKHHPSGKPSPTGKASPTGKPSHSGKPSASASASPSTSSSPSTSPSASPSPTPTQTKTAPEPPPAGYQWFQVTAASVGTIAGFKVAAPVGWVMNPGLLTTIKPTSGGGKLAVNLSQWAVPGAVREAHKLQAAAIANGNYPHYRLIALTGARFHNWPAARWIFRWRPVGAIHPQQVTDLLFTVQTYEGPQEYVLTVSAPLPKESLASDIFSVAKQTFKALPAP
jgi:hypothetical protein